METLLTLSELLSAAKNTEGKLYKVDQDGVDEAYFKHLPEDLKTIGFGKDHATSLNKYNKEFQYEYANAHTGSLGAWLKEHTEIDNVTVSNTFNGGDTLAIDFARPKGDTLTRDDWENSFAHRRSCEADERLTTELRTVIGDLWDE